MGLVARFAVRALPVAPRFVSGLFLVTVLVFVAPAAVTAMSSLTIAAVASFAAFTASAVRSWGRARASLRDRGRWRVAGAAEEEAPQFYQDAHLLDGGRRRGLGGLERDRGRWRNGRYPGGNHHR
jgi:hypothetical protein